MLFEKRLATAFLTAALLAPIPAAGAELRPGVVVDVERQRLYLMSPDKAVEAVDLANGRVLWQSDRAARPLALGDGKLTAQSENVDTPNTLGLVVLDAERGEPVTQNALALPAGIEASVDDRLESRFRASAVTVGGNAYVSWNHQEVPVRALPPLTGLPGARQPGSPSPQSLQPPPAPAQKVSSGTIELNLSTGSISETSPAALPPATVTAMQAGARPPVRAVGPRQRLSVDGNHVLTSERVGDDRVWDKYRWTVNERETGRKVGELRVHLSQAAFIVLGSRIVFETGPFARRTSGGVVNEPPKVRAVDLAPGEEIWGRAVRDTAVRGALPP